MSAVHFRQASYNNFLFNMQNPCLTKSCLEFGCLIINITFKLFGFLIYVVTKETYPIEEMYFYSFMIKKPDLGSKFWCYLP